MELRESAAHKQSLVFQSDQESSGKEKHLDFGKKAQRHCRGWESRGWDVDTAPFRQCSAALQTAERVRKGSNFISQQNWCQALGCDTDSNPVLLKKSWAQLLKPKLKTLARATRKKKKKKNHPVWRKQNTHFSEFKSCWFSHSGCFENELPPCWAVLLDYNSFPGISRRASGCCNGLWTLLLHPQQQVQWWFSTAIDFFVVSTWMFTAFLTGRDTTFMFC